MARVEFAPDGKHFYTIKTAVNSMRLWGFLNGTDVAIQLAVNPCAKFRLIGEDDFLIAEKPKP